MKTKYRIHALAGLLLILALLTLGSQAQAKIDGIIPNGSNEFYLTATTGYISAGDGQTIHFWGYADDTGTVGVQYPGPTLILQEGDTYTVQLTNNLSEPTSLIFPGMTMTGTTATLEGLVAMEIAPGKSATYSFTADNPGTYMYQTGTNMALQVEMGLSGAIIVRPAGFDANTASTWKAYGDAATSYDHEVLYFHTEMDHRIHDAVDFGRFRDIDNGDFFPFYWFYNGRTAPDTWAPSGAPWLPNQPYDCFPKMRPGERMLIRTAGGGRDAHPFHHHGSSGTIIAVDGNVLDVTAGSGVPDAGPRLFTQTVVPGQTMDVMFDIWYGADLGWDIHGHTDIETPYHADLELLGNGTLAVQLEPGDETLTLDDGSGFPDNRPFRAIIWDPADGSFNATGGTREVVMLRKPSFVDGAPPTANDDVFHVMGEAAGDGARGLEDTSEETWSVGSVVTATFHGRIMNRKLVRIDGTTLESTGNLPTILPDQKDLFFGGFYSGSPFLGAAGALPPGEGGLNLNNGLAFMWHSHNEKEMTNNDIFPGGQMSFMIIDPLGTVIETSEH